MTFNERFFKEIYQTTDVGKWWLPIDVVKLIINRTRHNVIMRKYDIFISYRREGGYDAAKHLFDLLRKDKYRVSFDFDSMRTGNYDKQLLRNIDHCKDFVLIVDDHCFDRILKNNDSEDDWVRIELAHALKKDKNIIPVVISGNFSFPDNLPEDVADIKKKHIPRYDKYSFDSFYKDLKSKHLISKPRRSWIIVILLSILIATSVSIFHYKNIDHVSPIIYEYNENLKEMIMTDVKDKIPQDKKIIVDRVDSLQFMIIDYFNIVGMTPTYSKTVRKDAKLHLVSIMDMFNWSIDINKRSQNITKEYMSMINDYPLQLIPNYVIQPNMLEEILNTQKSYTSYLAKINAYISLNMQNPEQIINRLDKYYKSEQLADYLASQRDYFLTSFKKLDLYKKDLNKHN